MFMHTQTNGNKKKLRNQNKTINRETIYNWNDIATR